jgi:hypothetical protein
MNVSPERDGRSRSVYCIARRNSNESTEMLTLEPEIVVVM